MEFLNIIYAKIQGLDTRQFYKYIGILFSIMLLIIGFLFFQQYRTITKLKLQVRKINESREEVKTILDQLELVRQEKKEVNEMLAEDENFKIAGYFQELLKELNLSNKASETVIDSTERTENYNETNLSVKLVGITMKQLTKLLQKLNDKKRIYTKELEISTSKKIPNSIDVTLNIATLQPKKEETE